MSAAQHRGCGIAALPSASRRIRCTPDLDALAIASGVFRHAQFEQLAPVPTSLVACIWALFAPPTPRGRRARDVLRELLRTGRKLRRSFSARAWRAHSLPRRQRRPGIGVEFALAHALSLGVHDGEVYWPVAAQVRQLPVVLNARRSRPLVSELRREQIRPRRSA